MEKLAYVNTLSCAVEELQIQVNLLLLSLEGSLHPETVTTLLTWDSFF